MQKIHTLVGHMNPDLECCAGLFALRHIPIFRDAFGVVENPELKFVPAGTELPENSEENGILGFDVGKGRLDQHGKLAELEQQFASLDLMVHLAGAAGRPEYDTTLKFLFDLIAKNDLTAADICMDHDYRKGKWPHSQRTLRNLATALNFLHEERPDAVVGTMDLAFAGMIAYVEQGMQRIENTARPVGVTLTVEAGDYIATAVKEGYLVDRSEIEARDTLVRSAFLVPNIIKGLAALGDEMVARFTAAYEAAMDLYEAEFVLAERDFWDRNKTFGFSGVPLRVTDAEGNVTTRDITVALVISDSERIGQVARRGNWAKNPKDRSKKPYPDRESRRPADVVIHVHERNHKRFTISSKGVDLSCVAAAIRTADVMAKGVRGMTAEQVRTLVEPGHGQIRKPDGTAVPFLYLAEFKTAFGHLRSGRQEQSALSVHMLRELTLRALTEGLSPSLVGDILHRRVLR